MNYVVVVRRHGPRFLEPTGLHRIQALEEAAGGLGKKNTARARPKASNIFLEVLES